MAPSIVSHKRTLQDRTGLGVDIYSFYKQHGHQPVLFEAARSGNGVALEVSSIVLPGAPDNLPELMAHWFPEAEPSDQEQGTMDAIAEQMGASMARVAVSFATVPGLKRTKIGYDLAYHAAFMASTTRYAQPEAINWDKLIFRNTPVFSDDDTQILQLRTEAQFWGPLSPSLSRFAADLAEQLVDYGCQVQVQLIGGQADDSRPLAMFAAVERARQRVDAQLRERKLRSA